MRYNYLPNSEDDSLVNYSFKSSYLQNEKTQNKSGVNSYQLLPEEYDVFSNLNLEDLFNKLPKQYPLAMLVLKAIRQQLLSVYEVDGLVCVLPKLSFYIDNEQTLHFNLANSNFRVFFSFEPMEQSDAAFCGLIVQENESSVTTQTIAINSENYESIVSNVLTVVFENS